jgi:hypothetical protein
MTVNLVTEAKKVLLMSWSARLGALAAILQALAEFQDQLPLIRDFIPHGVFSLLAIVCAIAVPLSRIIKQQGLIDAINTAQAEATAAQAPVDVPVAAGQVDVTNIPPPVQPPPRVVPVVIERRAPPKQVIVVNK